jgi:hypothetical protein
MAGKKRPMKTTKLTTNQAILPRLLILMDRAAAGPEPATYT